MGQTHQINHDFHLSDARLEAMFEVFDDLHTAASEGQLEALTTLNNRELVGWLRDLVYTAQETISEIERQTPYPPIRLVTVEADTVVQAS
jgi:hypothetical protein